MAGEQWISGIVGHGNIMVTKYQPRATSFIFTWHNLSRMPVNFSGIILSRASLAKYSSSFWTKCNKLTTWFGHWVQSTLLLFLLIHSQCKNCKLHKISLRVEKENKQSNSSKLVLTVDNLSSNGLPAYRQLSPIRLRFP